MDPAGYGLALAYKYSEAEGYTTYIADDELVLLLMCILCFALFFLGIIIFNKAFSKKK